MEKNLIEQIAKLKAEQTFLFKKAEQVEQRIQQNEEKLILLKSARGY